MGPAYELFGVRKLQECTETEGPYEGIDGEKGIVLGTIRMGFGHYRIGLALASAARSMGLTPYWMDLMSFPDSAASRTINYLEDLYNLGSQISQRYKWFDKLIWEKVTSDMAKRLSYTTRDRALSKLFAPLLSGIPKDVPFLSTHPWTGHAAVRAGLSDVVTLIPDNYPIAFHLVEGSVHAVQTPSAYMGYRTLRDMGGKRELIHALPQESIRNVGHYVTRDQFPPWKRTVDIGCAVCVIGDPPFPLNHGRGGRPGSPFRGHRAVLQGRHRKRPPCASSQHGGPRGALGRIKSSFDSEGAPAMSFIRIGKRRKLSPRRYV